MPRRGKAQPESKPEAAPPVRSEPVALPAPRKRTKSAVSDGAKSAKTVETAAGRTTAGGAARKNASPAATQNPDADTYRDDIARLAYHLWQERGCPADSAEQDWLRAEEEIRQRRVSKS